MDGEITGALTLSVAQAAEYQKCFADLLALEEYRRSRGQGALGGEGT